MEVYINSRDRSTALAARTVQTFHPFAGDELQKTVLWVTDLPPQVVLQVFSGLDMGRFLQERVELIVLPAQQVIQTLEEDPTSGVSWFEPHMIVVDHIRGEYLLEFGDEHAECMLGLGRRIAEQLLPEFLIYTNDLYDAPWRT